MKKMDKLSKNLGARVVLYMVMLLFAVGVILAGCVMATNINNRWYSKDEKDFKQDVRLNIAQVVRSRLDDMVYIELIASGDEPEEGGEYVNSAGNGYYEAVSIDEYAMIFSDEDADGQTEFGYGVYGMDEARNDNPEDSGIDAVYKEINGKLVNPEYSTVDEEDKEGTDETSLKTRLWLGDTVLAYIYIGDLEGEGVPEEMNYIYSVYNMVYSYRVEAMIATPVFALICIAIFIMLMCAAGRNREKKTFMNRLPMDLSAVISVATALGALEIIYIGESSIFLNYELAIAIGMMIAVAGIAVITGCMLIFAVQAKAGDLWRHTVLYRLVRLLRKAGFAFGRVNMVWRAVLAVAVWLAISILLMIVAYDSFGDEFWVWLWIIFALLSALFALYTAICLRRLHDCAQALAEGNIEYKMDTRGLLCNFKENAEYLNDISSGMSKAVEERLRSERFKTELITNVSHDLKTPITSIVSYVDFLKSEDIDSEKAREYIEVLDRQSQRLKKLTEDLVEASRAAAGNVSLDLAPCDAGVMMTQCMGEYKEKADKQDLELVMNLPEESVMIMADGRSMWRVLDNLLNNICKYSQPGTRVYQSLEKENGRALIIYKNISKNALNISGEELTKRFVRSDSSRHTEGSGLGLSIAKNLTVLQGGSFDIDIDGDLFKVVIGFDIVDEM